MLHFVPTFGMAKKGVSYMIEAASIAYRDAGFRYVHSFTQGCVAAATQLLSVCLSVLLDPTNPRCSFYYTDERHENAAPVLDKWDGPMRAEMCYKLATEKGRPWQQTYVKGRGYVDFRRQDFEERLRRMDTGIITDYPAE